MNRFLQLSAAALMVLTSRASADGGTVDIRLSIKIITDGSGNNPTSGITAPDTVEAKIDRDITDANDTLRRTQRGYRLKRDPFIYISPPVPSMQPSTYWFTLPARQNRATVEAAATAAPTTWAWSGSAVNFYVNHSSSGQCSFPPDSHAITLGSGFIPGTVLHELGHFFALRHTHAGDYADQPAGPNFTAADLADGDSLTETANDNPNITTRDQLSVALWNAPYASLTVSQQNVVNSAWRNVMSYHVDEDLLPVQMNILTDHANNTSTRHYAVSGWTRFIAPTGSDTIFGLSNNCIVSGVPGRTLAHAVSHAAGANDGHEIILLGAGTYSGPITIGSPVTLRTDVGQTAVIGAP
jgi:hypothetical protein